MRILAAALAALLILSGAASARSTIDPDAQLKKAAPAKKAPLKRMPTGASTVNGAVPGPGSALNSAVIRNNFAAAAADITGIETVWTGPTAPLVAATGTPFCCWLDTHLGNPYAFQFYDGAQWVALGYVNATTHSWNFALTGLVAHGVVIGQGAAPVTVTAPGASGVPLLGQGPTNDPLFLPLDLSGAGVTGILGVPNGGWGLGTLTANAIYKGAGASPPTPSALSDDGTTVSSTESLSVKTNAIISEIANDGTTGTTNNRLAKLTGSGQAVIALTTDIDNVVGVVIGGSGTTGSAAVAVAGQAVCTFDGATTAGNWVTISATTSGDCHDAGASRPLATQVIGRVLSTNGGGGNYAMTIAPGLTNTSGGGSGTVNNCGSVGYAAYYAGAGTAVSCETLSAMIDALIGSTRGTILERGAGGWTLLGPGLVNQPLVSQGAGADSIFESLSALIDAAIGSTRGAILERGASGWQLVTPGAAGTVYTSNGAGADPSYQASAVPVGTPGLRLTLVTGTPVMRSDQTAKTVIYATPRYGNSYPWYNGSAWSSRPLLADISLTLDAANALSGNLYDIFAYNNGGTDVLCYGPAWTNSTTRSAAIAMLAGIWTNNGSITCRAAVGTTYTVAANQGTLLGTFYATANGQTGVQFKPAAAAGGSNAVIGLANVYNLANVFTRSQDSTATWSLSGSSAWTTSDSSNSNRITYIDPLGQIAVRALFSETIDDGGAHKEIGINQDSTSATPDTIGHNDNGSASGGRGVFVVHNEWPPTLGLHYLQAMQRSSATTSQTWYGHAIQASGSSSSTEHNLEAHLAY